MTEREHPKTNQTARNKMQQEVVNVCCVHQRTEQTEEENEMQHEKIDTSKFSKCKSSQLC